MEARSSRDVLNMMVYTLKPSERGDCGGMRMAARTVAALPCSGVENEDVRASPGRIRARRCDFQTYSDPFHQEGAIRHVRGLAPRRASLSKGCLVVHTDARSGRGPRAGWLLVDRGRSGVSPLPADVAGISTESAWVDLLAEGAWLWKRALDAKPRCIPDGSQGTIRERRRCRVNGPAEMESDSSW